MGQMWILFIIHRVEVESSGSGQTSGGIYIGYFRRGWG